MKVAVLYGGLSKEREISIRTGEAVARGLKNKGYDVYPIDMKDYSAIQNLFLLKPDAAFIALHGKYGEDGSTQGVLEWLKIPYTGPGVFSSALCFDKIAAKKYLEDFGIPTPLYRILKHQDPLDVWIKKFDLKLPVVVKPNTEGSSIGVKRIFHLEELREALRETLNLDNEVLVEEMITGPELTVGVLNGSALPIIEIVPKSGFYDFEAKYTKGKTKYIIPARISDKASKDLLKMSERIYSLLKCEGAVRMDYMMSKDERPYFLEVNTIAGMTETSLLPKAAQAVDISFDDLCDRIVKGANLKLVK